MPFVRLQGTAETPAAWNCAGESDFLLRCDSPTTPTVFSIAARPVRQWDGPLDALAWMAAFNDPALPPGGRWVGYLSYDLGRQFESVPADASDDLGLPLFAFAYLAPRSASRVTAASSAGESQLLGSTFSRTAYEQAVQRSIDYIGAGDVFQVNLSQRFTARTTLSPAVLFDRLIRQSPARFGALLQFDDFAVISNSPELFLAVSPDQKVITRPIKGTRPNQPGMADELRDSIKDQAELNMIVDLERNDLGRVCEFGSVRVTEPRVIESHPTVLHGVATVEGTLRPDVDFVALLRATFPSGSVTGAPKIRAMQIIDELEPVRRGPYCGAIGVLHGDGSMLFNVAIRTMTLKDGHAYLPVGGGIVADSQPSAEYEETLVKASAMLAALGLSSDAIHE